MVTTVHDPMRMRFWAFDIVSDISQPVSGSGWVRAETADKALALISDPDAQVYPLPDDRGFPRCASGAVVWDVSACSSEPPSLMPSKDR